MDIAANLTLEIDKITIDNKKYSVEKMAAIHPGGELFVKAFAGRDATIAFLSYHRRQFPHHKFDLKSVDGVEAFFDDKLSPTTRVKSIVETCKNIEYIELCNLITQVVPLKQSYAPFSYFIKIFMLITTTICLELYIHYTKNYIWYLTGPLGVLFAWIGLNVQHDANHGAISPHFYINRGFGLMQSWIGGSSIVWIHQHVVQHHIYCNDMDRDPDMEGNQIIKLNPRALHVNHYMYQHIYFLGALALFGFSVVKDTIVSVANGVYFTPISPYLEKYRQTEQFLSYLFVIRWMFVPIYQVPTISTIMNVMVLYVVSGYYLSFFFLLSHNFVGSQHFTASSKESFLRQQVLSSSNVGGTILCWFNGGLNYQIEHHLFPRMHHSHYPKIAPIVKEFCRERDISYKHFDNIYDNLVSTSQYLYNISHENM